MEGYACRPMDQTIYICTFNLELLLYFLLLLTSQENSILTRLFLSYSSRLFLQLQAIKDFLLLAKTTTLSDSAVSECKELSPNSSVSVTLGLVNIDGEREREREIERERGTSRT